MKVIEKEKPHYLGIFLNKSGDKRIKYFKSTDKLALKNWNNKPYKCFTSYLCDILNYFIQIEDAQERQQEATFFLLQLSKVFDALTIKKPIGGTRKSSFDRKILAKVKKHTKGLKDIKFNEQDKLWLGHRHEKYEKTLNDLLKTVELMCDKKYLSNRARNSSQWLIHNYFDDSQTDFIDFITACIDDLELMKVKLTNTSIFKYKDLYKTIGFKKVEGDHDV